MKDLEDRAPEEPADASTEFSPSDVPILPGSADALAKDVQAVASIDVVPAMLRLVCKYTGMGFAAIARVTDERWVACAVHDAIDFGLGSGGELDVSTTLCREAREQRAPIVIESVTHDLVYRDHPTPRIYGLESYVSFPIVRADGTYFGNLCAIDTRPAPALARPETLATLRAFTQLVATQLDAEERRETAEAQLAAERANAELREHFVAVLGHDLRNPLGAVSTMAELLVRRGDQEPQAAQIGQRLRIVCRRMSDMIGDVLDLAQTKLGAGFVVHLCEHMDVASLLSDVVEEARIHSPQRVIEASIDVAGPVMCDTGRLQQLLSNLLGNAVAYGAADRPIRVDAHLIDGVLEIAVMNHGEPISAENLSRVFEPYWRSPEAAAGAGLGLGLYICAQIVRAHGGTLVAQSSREGGTRFTARMPVAARL